VALAMILVILVLPEGIVPSVARQWRGWRSRAAAESSEGGSGSVAADGTRSGSDGARPGSLASDAADVSPGLLATATPARGEERTRNFPTLLDCRDLWKAFGGIQALRGVSLTVSSGEIVGLVGPNGSGKTTLINVISGHYRADRGRVELDSLLLSGRPAHDIARLGISRTYQIPRPFAHLTVVENVALSAMFGGGD